MKAELVKDITVRSATQSWHNLNSMTCNNFGAHRAGRLPVGSREWPQEELNEPELVWAEGRVVATGGTRLWILFCFLPRRLHLFVVVVVYRCVGLFFSFSCPFCLFLYWLLSAPIHVFLSPIPWYLLSVLSLSFCVAPKKRYQLTLRLSRQHNLALYSVRISSLVFLTSTTPAYRERECRIQKGVQIKEPPRPDENQCVLCVCEQFNKTSKKKKKENRVSCTRIESRQTRLCSSWKRRKRQIKESLVPSQDRTMSVRRVKGSYRNSLRRFGSGDPNKAVRNSAWIFRNNEWRLIFGKSSIFLRLPSPFYIIPFVLLLFFFLFISFLPG